MPVTVTCCMIRSTQPSLYQSKSILALVSARILLLLFVFFSVFKSANAFTTHLRFNALNLFVENMEQQQKPSLLHFEKPRVTSASASTTLQVHEGHHISVCELPGDPSLILTTNVNLGATKMDVMKALSKAVSKHTGKPESYVAISITDNASMIFGGSDAPLALGCLYSIGSIEKESNGAITSSVTDALEPFGVAADRIYINCFDVPRANCGWNRQTFAG